jgi:hypothetical protein
MHIQAYISGYMSKEANILKKILKSKLYSTLAGAGLGAGGAYLLNEYDDPYDTNVWDDMLGGALTGGGLGFAASSILGPHFVEDRKRTTPTSVEAKPVVNKTDLQSKSSLKPADALAAQYGGADKLQKSIDDALAYQKDTGYTPEMDISLINDEIPVQYKNKAEMRDITNRDLLGVYRSDLKGSRISKKILEAGKGDIFVNKDQFDDIIKRSGRSADSLSTLILAHELRHSMQRARKGDNLVKRHTQGLGRQLNSSSSSDALKKGEAISRDHGWNMNSSQQYAILDTKEREERLGALKSLAYRKGLRIRNTADAEKFLKDVVKGKHDPWFRGKNFNALDDAREMIEYLRKTTPIDRDSLIRKMSEEMPAVVRNSIVEKIVKMLS